MFNKNLFSIPRLPDIRGPCGASLVIAASMMLAPLGAMAGPIFPMPGNPAVHPPGFVVHIATGIGVLPPGGALPPLPFGDALASPDLWHWEIELNNGAGGPPMAFNVMFTAPTIAPIVGGVFLPPGSSVYFDIHVPDVPEIAPPGTYMMTAAATPGLLAPVLVDSAVIEYPFLVAGPPGLGAVLFGGPPGAGFGPAMPGAPTVTISIIPGPPALALLALSMFVGSSRRRRV